MSEDMNSTQAAQESLRDSEQARRDDEPTLAFVHGIVGKLRNLRIENNWAPAIRANFQGR